jgi:hypothetical protein
MSLQPYAAILFFSIRLNKKYIGQFTYRFGNPVRYPPFTARYFHIHALLDIHGDREDIKRRDFNSVQNKIKIRLKRIKLCVLPVCQLLTQLSPLIKKKRFEEFAGLQTILTTAI